MPPKHPQDPSKDPSGPKDPSKDHKDPGEHHKDWARAVAGMKTQSAAIDWSRVDFSQLQASDVGVKFGPLLTEEQFKQYRKGAAGDVHVVKAPTKKS